MAFQTPQHTLAKYLEWTTSGHIQLPDFQRQFKWEDERIRQLLVTVLRGHPMGAVMLLSTGNDQVRFKPRPIEGVALADGSQAEWLLLDGQQRLTSLTQALTGSGVVKTMDARGKDLERRYYLDIDVALLGDDRMDEAVKPIPADGTVRSNFGRDVEFDVSTEAKELEARHFPLRLLYDPFAASTWLSKLSDGRTMPSFIAKVLQPAGAYAIPAIQLDNSTTKSAVATVFEKVNTGGLPLNVFELLTSLFAGDADYYARHGEDFRLNDDWKRTKAMWQSSPVLSTVESTDFLQAVTMLTTLKRNRESASERPPAVSAKREDVLKLTLGDYLEWRDTLREAFVWASTFLADRFVFVAKEVPYPKQLVPLAAIRVVLGQRADLIGVRGRIVRWYWCGILGELYGGSIESRFARDIEQVPDWVLDSDSNPLPRTIVDATFVESRLLSLRTRNAAAYKGIAALVLAQGARDWMEDKALDKVQYTDLAVDIHHVFPQKWCNDNRIDDQYRESIINKTAIGAKTNRTIGGVAPSQYVGVIERNAQIDPDRLDSLLTSHCIDPVLLRQDAFEAFFDARRDSLCTLIEQAMGKAVQRDLTAGAPTEDSSFFEPDSLREDQSDGEA
ncbi:MAG: DUF262 domain-containing protein [Nigerium sp.]|nr:DUF262 domain-containing protein [Nigerium sp.]